MATSFQLHDSDDEVDLPFPEPLPRSAFLNPDFSPTDLLSSLTSRHQTLYDLRAELTSRSQSIASELLTLVNNEYQAFLGLGQDLRGGSDKVNEVKVGVLAFEKGVAGLRDVVASRRQQVDSLVKEREAIRDEVSYGRAMLLLADQVEELEVSLSLGEQSDAIDDWSEDEEDDSDVEDADQVGTVNIARLRRLVQSYVAICDEIEDLGHEQPFLKKLSERIRTIRQTLLLDLGTALKQTRERGSAAASRVLKIMQLYADMDATSEALQIIKTKR